VKHHAARARTIGRKKPSATLQALQQLQQQQQQQPQQQPGTTATNSSSGQTTPERRLSAAAVSPNNTASASTSSISGGGGGALYAFRITQTVPMVTEKKGQFTVYLIQVQAPDKSTTDMYKRYSQFAELHDSVRRRGGRRRNPNTMPNEKLSARSS
jgi:hypothetical protein